MSTVEMWWGKTTWWYPNAISITPTSGKYRIGGLVEGPGCGFFGCDGLFRYITFVAEFWLGKNRMPSDNNDFRSIPNVSFTGDITAFADYPFSIFDNSFASCWLTFEQRVYFGTTLQKKSIRSINLVSVEPGLGNFVAFETKEMPSEVAFDPLYFFLYRGSDLIIQLEVKFNMFLYGFSSMRYSIWRDSFPFTVQFHQWSIESEPH